MDRKTEKEFEELMLETVSRVQRIECSQKDYQEGLKMLIEELQDLIEE